MAKKKTEEGVKIITQNKKARFEYHVEDKIEAGMVLVGSEVKSLRDNRASLVDSYAVINQGECFLHKAHIAIYEPSAQFNHEPTRTRKLLMHKSEIGKLTTKLKERGFTLIPLRLYFKKGKAKVELGLCKGKKQYDKRAAIKKREAKREVSRALRRKH
jgi:SsrA-binding protein